jgi:hypothetical protein
MQERMCDDSEPKIKANHFGPAHRSHFDCKLLRLNLPKMGLHTDCCVQCELHASSCLTSSNSSNDPRGSFTLPPMSFIKY